MAQLIFMPCMSCLCTSVALLIKVKHAACSPFASGWGPGDMPIWKVLQLRVTEFNMATASLCHSTFRMGLRGKRWLTSAKLHKTLSQQCREKQLKRNKFRKEDIWLETKSF
uniref:Secreted protein n=1 Tax=Naja naja TaxID=35670 RepID=A0A8C6XZT0_NAJNA